VTLLVRPAGTNAALLEFDRLEEVAAWQDVVAALVANADLPPPTEVVPGARTLLLDGVDPAIVSQALAQLETPAAVPGVEEAPPVELPVVYDGADLADVARLWGVSERELVARHTGTEFRVAFCGFAPGFPYMVGFDEEVPRRATPRASVPAGSVGLAGRYCGIYPSSSPGGWQLIGTTSATLFDVDRDPPALMPPGTRVRFVEASNSSPEPGQAGGPGNEVLIPAGGRALTVVRPGALTTVQDAGRIGLAHLGVPRAGALDVDAARLANRLVGNPEDAAVLETTLNGVGLRAVATATVAVTGAQAPVTVDGRPVSWGIAVAVAGGAVLDVGAPSVGVRSYVAVAGGIAVPPVLGSRSTDTLSHLGPAPLVAGAALRLGTPSRLAPAVDFTVPLAHAEPVVLRLLPGPRDDWFGEPGLSALVSAAYELSPLSNRIGVRLSGPPVARLLDEELESEGIVLGAVQVPPDGQPVVLLADHPTTGGYPVIGVVEQRDLGALAQARPGTAVRFVRSTQNRSQ
jgi:KipI family sensor histidine kinase inhibitor